MKDNIMNNKEVTFDETSLDSNKKRLNQALKDLEKYPFADLTISKYHGVIKSYRLAVEVRFKEDG